MNRLLPPIALLSLAAAGCTAILAPGEQQCETTADCEARGFASSACQDGVCVEVDPVWGCLGNVVEPEPDPTQKIDFTMGLVLAGSKDPVVDAIVDICDKLDVECAASSPNMPKGVKPDEKGVVKVSLAQGFDGFVRVTSPTTVDARIYVGRPLLKPPTSKEIWLLRQQDYNLLAVTAGLSVDENRGSAILLAHDCQDLPVSGVSFESPDADAGSTEFYLINQFPATPPSATATDVDGYGGFFNLPVGAAVARTTLAKDGTFVGESSFQVLAKTISYVQIAPTPK